MTEAVRLQVEGVTVRFGGTIALDGVHLSVAPGEVLALVGENGAGKSTLMKVLSGAILPDAGTMTLDGQPYGPRDPREARNHGIAMIYQELSLAPSLTVRDNIMLGVEPARMGVLDDRQMNEQAGKALAELGHAIPLDAPVKWLSVSDQQLVEIARASAVGCRVLILDEPTSSITQTDVQRLFQLIRRMKAAGQSIIYISHFIEEVREIADRFVVLRDGQSVGAGNVADHSTAQIVALMVGRELQDLHPRSARSPGEPILEVTGLSSLPRVNSATLALKSGEVVGIFGLVGSGRSDLVRAIFGLAPVQSGKVRVGIYEGAGTPARRWSQGIGIVSEDRKSEGLALSRSIAENLILPYPQSVESGALLSPSRMKQAARGWIDRLSVRCRSADQKIAELSGGNQQKIALARLLHRDVDVLLLDEPTRGIDVGCKRQIFELIDSLATQNKAVLMISSYLPDLLGICDRIAVMNRGRLSPPRPVSELDEHAIMLAAVGSGTGDRP